MFKLPDFTAIDFSRLDVNALRNIDLSKYVPNIDLPTVDAEKFTAAVRDAAYLTVGIGSVAFEQAQARRRLLVEQVNAVEARVDTVVDKIEGILPDQAGALFGQARDFSRVARKQVRGLLRTAA